MDEVGSYDRDVLIDVLVRHQRVMSDSCSCGWRQYGKRQIEHVADRYEAALTPQRRT